VGAMLGVEAGVGEAEARDRTVVKEVFGDDLLDIASVDVAVPDGFGIDDDYRTVFTLVETAGFVGANMVLETRFLNGVFERCFELLTSLRKAAGTGGGFVTLVRADEDVVVEFWQSVVPYLLMRCNSLSFLSLLKMRCTGVFETIDA